MPLLHLWEASTGQTLLCRPCYPLTEPTQRGWELFDMFSPRGLSGWGRKWTLSHWSLHATTSRYFWGCFKSLQTEVGGYSSPSNLGNWERLGYRGKISPYGVECLNHIQEYWAYQPSPTISCWHFQCDGPAALPWHPNCSSCSRPARLIRIRS
jgi:hypothetical protein